VDRMGEPVHCANCGTVFMIARPADEKANDRFVERQTRGVPVRVLVASVAVAFLLGIALARGAAFLHFQAEAARIQEALESARHVAAAPAQPPAAPAPVAKAREPERAVDAPEPPKPPVAPARPRVEDQPAPAPPPEAPAQNNPPTERDTGIPLPSIGGWVMLQDGTTLILALPDEAKLVYIDTAAHKEIKRVDLPFKPDRLAVHGRHLCASVQASSEIHILDRDTGAHQRELKVQGTVEDMVGHPDKGIVVGTLNPSSAMIHRLFAIDAAAGTIAVAGDLASAQVQMRANPQMVGPGRLYQVTVLSMAGGGRLLALDPRNAGALYVASDTGSGRHPEDRRYWLGLSKYDVEAKFRMNRVLPAENSPGYAQPGVGAPGSAQHNSRYLPLGLFWPLKHAGVLGVASPAIDSQPPGALHVSGDGKHVGVLGGGGQINVYESGDIKSQAGRINCPGAIDFVFHPMLDLIAAEGSDGAALYFFDGRSFTQTGKIALGPGPFPNSKAGRLLTMGSRGTELVYYDRLRGGYLRSYPLTLSAEQRDALGKAYPTDVQPPQKRAP
jgi:hypothetical protein